MPPATDVKVCAMYDNNCDVDNPFDLEGMSDEWRCDEPVVEGSDFCQTHQDVKLCKTSGLVYIFSGTSGFNSRVTMSLHPVGEGRTKRAEFCSGRCRNLWRDTRNRIARDEAIGRAIDGKPSDRYSIIKNYNNTDRTVVYDKKLHRRLP